ncbi:TPA: nucleoside-diphosphate kinase [Candidatus Bathyarchaeota archaeon]|nr:nucleoside-diphosphate kinase [Candidatus Bathyarchaeota archaeon]
MERTLVFIKPDAVARGLVGEVIKRVEEAGLRIVALKMLRLTNDQAEQMYAVHRGKPFYRDLVDFVSSGPIVAMVVKGRGAIRAVRELIGATNPREAKPGTIRADFGTGVLHNVVHASDSTESVDHEMPIIFDPDELVER